MSEPHEEALLRQRCAELEREVDALNERIQALREEAREREAGAE